MAAPPDLQRLRRLSVNSWFKEFFGDSRKSYLELFQANSPRLLALLDSWRAPSRGPRGSPEASEWRLERFFVALLLRFFVALVEFISVKREKQRLAAELESTQARLAEASTELDRLGGQLAFLPQNLQVLRTE